MPNPAPEAPLIPPTRIHSRAARLWASAGVSGVSFFGGRSPQSHFRAAASRTRGDQIDADGWGSFAFPAANDVSRKSTRFGRKGRK